MLLSWLATKLVNWVFARLRAGHARPALALYANDVEMRFPGRNSWSGAFHGKPELRRWLSRFTDAGLQIFADEVVAIGPPWRATLCIRGHDYAKSPAGETVYENRYVIWAKLRWGRIYDEETYEDTEKPLALDAWLQQREPAQLAGEPRDFMAPTGG
jgi:ketosteroid isomerase-like protein